MFLDVKGSLAALQNVSRHHREISGRLEDDKQSKASAAVESRLLFESLKCFNIFLNTKNIFRMEETKSHKKRKRPFNWDDIYQSSSEDERQIIKKRVSQEYNI